jgi:hypothetical protein
MPFPVSIAAAPDPAPAPCPHRAPAHLPLSSSNTAQLQSDVRRVQELEFIIYPDGRIEERVLGVKGADCQKLTEKINQELGEVYSTEATAEMFEQPVQVNVEEEVENTQSAWSDSGSSYGGSTW